MLTDADTTLTDTSLVGVLFQCHTLSLITGASRNAISNVSAAINHPDVPPCPPRTSPRERLTDRRTADRPTDCRGCSLPSHARLVQYTSGRPVCESSRVAHRSIRHGLHGGSPRPQTSPISAATTEGVTLNRSHRRGQTTGIRWWDC